MEELIQMIVVTNFLNISAIFELACAYLASQFRDKSFDQVKKDYNLENE